MPPTTSLFRSKPETIKPILDDIEQQFDLDEEALTSITTQFLADFNHGLSEYGEAMAMIPTFVQGVPNGTETGTFLALDLGGTNLRVCQVELRGDKTFTLRQQKYKVSEALKTGEAVTLFDYMADSVDAFLTSSPSGVASLPPSLDDEEKDPLPLGLTFSFPVEQTALDQGYLLTWTKGFSAKNAIGRDIVKLLQDAFDKKHLHVKCVALVNDTVGTLLSRAYTAGGCILGAIFGTGTNGAYVEKVQNIPKLKNSTTVLRGDDMIVNTEWGGFNNSRTVLPTTPFDNKLDRESINPRKQVYEKFISGMYLGEITRNILVALLDAAPYPIVFNGKASHLLNQHYGLDSEIMSHVEEAWNSEAHIPPAEIVAVKLPASDETEHPHAEKLTEKTLLDFTKPLTAATIEPHTLHRLQRIRAVIVARLGYAPEDVTLRDAAVVRWACSIVARRGALLSGCAVAVVARQMGFVKGLGKDAVSEGEGPIAVGVDGSLIQFYPRFEETMREALRLLVGETIEKRIDIGLAKDGSGVGAALCALQAVKQQQGS
ncbi:hexokinase [Dentipellis sp. KUC8613]|nr:hexokinase [Dentipellis sp. KUC8613]